MTEEKYVQNLVECMAKGQAAVSSEHLSKLRIYSDEKIANFLEQDEIDQGLALQVRKLLNEGKL